MEIEDILDEIAKEEDVAFVRPCDRCHKDRLCEEIPMMGYSEFLCGPCAAAAYRFSEAV